MSIRILPVRISNPREVPTSSPGGTVDRTARATPPTPRTPIVVTPRVDPTTTTTTRFVPPPGWTGSSNPGPTQRTDYPAREFTVNATSGVIPVVYGRSKVGGQIILIHLQGDYLYAAAAFSEGPIDGYETVLVDNKAFPSATLYTGTNSQGVDTVLAGLTLVGGSWDTGLPGLAYVVCKIPIADVQGFPTITAIIRGKKYRDPRITPVSGTFLDYANRVYGANPVLIIADLLTDNLYGAQFPDAKLNWTGTISDSADYCDNDIAPTNPVAALTISLHTGGGSLNAGTYSYKYTRVDSTDNETAASPVSNTVTAAAGDYITITGFGTQPAGTTLVTLYRCAAGNAVSGPWKILAGEPATTTTINDPNPDSNLGTTLPPGSKIQTHRFEFNGVLQQAANLADWIDTLRSHCQASIPFNGVTYDIICDRPWTVDPVHVFTADDIVGESLQVVRAGFDGVPTAVEITYTDAQNDFKDALCIREIAAVTAGTEDRRTSTYALKGCTSADQSQRHAVYFLNKRTSDVTISFQTFQTGLLIENGDVFAITHPIGFSAALFRAEKVSLDADGGGWTISGREYSSLVYVDYVLEADPGTSTFLPDPKAIPPDVTGLTAPHVTEADLGKVYFTPPSGPTAVFIKYFEILDNYGTPAGPLIIATLDVISAPTVMQPFNGSPWIHIENNERVFDIVVKSVSSFGIKSPGVSVNWAVPVAGRPHTNTVYGKAYELSNTRADGFAATQTTPGTFVGTADTIRASAYRDDSVPKDTLFRTFLEFDTLDATTGLGTDVTVVAVVLQVYMSGLNNGTVHVTDSSAANMPLTSADWNLISYADRGESGANNGASNFGYTDILLSSPSLLNRSGKTKLALVIADDLNSTRPADQEGEIFSADGTPGGVNGPRLVITYSSALGDLVTTTGVGGQITLGGGLTFPLTPPPPDVSTVTTTQGSNGGSITSGATSVVVTSSTGFPPTPFLVSIGTENIKVTTVAGTTWTISRGYNSTSAASHADGATITLVNWEWVNQGITTTTQGSNGGSITSGATSVVVTSSAGFPSTPFVVSIGTEDIEVTTVAGTTWTIVRGYYSTSAASHADGATITLVSGIATTAQIVNGILFSMPNNSSGNSLRIRKRLIGSNTAIAAAFLPSAVSSSNSLVGLCLRESATGKIVTFCVSASANGPVLYVQRWSGWGTWTANDVPGLPYLPSTPMWLRIEPTVTQMLFYVSADGQNWAQVMVGGLTKTTAFTTAADEWGMVITNNTTSYIASIALVSWKEVP